MGTTFESTFKSRVNGNQATWAALGAIGVAVLALVASVIYIQAPLEEPSLAVLPDSTPAPTPTNQASAEPATPAPTTGHRAGR